MPKKLKTLDELSVIKDGGIFFSPGDREDFYLSPERNTYIIECGKLRCENFGDMNKFLKRLERDAEDFFELKTPTKTEYTCAGDVYDDMIDVLEMVIYRHDAKKITTFFKTLADIEKEEKRKRAGELIFCAGPLREGYRLEGYIIKRDASVADKVNEWLSTYDKRIADVLVKNGYALLEVADRLKDIHVNSISEYLILERKDAFTDPEKESIEKLVPEKLEEVRKRIRGEPGVGQYVFRYGEKIIGYAAIWDGWEAHEMERREPIIDFIGLDSKSSLYEKYFRKLLAKEIENIKSEWG